MQIKPGVYGNIHIALVPVVAEYEVWRRKNMQSEGTITAAQDGRHSPRSYHYEGRAVDLRTRDMSQLEIDTLVAHLRNRFTKGAGYDVVKESTHIHVEYEGRLEVPRTG